MRAWISGSLALAAAAVFGAGGALAQQAWVTVGSHGGAGWAASSWWQGMNADGVAEVVVVDDLGQRRRFRCPPGQSIAVVQSGGNGATTVMRGGSGAGWIGSSVGVGGGEASAVTILGDGSGVSVVAGSGASSGTGSALSVACR